MINGIIIQVSQTQKRMNLKIKNCMKKTLLLFTLILSAITYGQDYDKGKGLFKQNCAACHNMEKKMVGPALKNVVNDQGREWTKEWIYNSNALINSGDEHANEVWEEYNKIAMPAYNWLEDDELESIVTYLADYTKVQAEKMEALKPKVSEGGVQAVPVNVSTPLYVWILLVVCVVMVVLTVYVVNIAMKTILQHATRYQSVNKHLMNRLGLDTSELEKEFDEYLDEEVNKKVEKKIKIIKKEINEKLNKLN